MDENNLPYVDRLNLPQNEQEKDVFSYLKAGVDLRIGKEPLPDNTSSEVAELVMYNFAQYFRYISELVGWYYYDETRGLWAEDIGDQHITIATLEVIYALQANDENRLKKATDDYVELLNETKLSKEEMKQYEHELSLMSQKLKATKHLKDRSKRRNIIADCQNSCTVSISKFEKNNTKLSVPNGVVDLETGKLLPKRPDNYFLSASPTVYDPQAQSDVFNKFLSDITGNNKALAENLQVIFGYGIIGSNPERLIAMLYGPTSTGKSTLTSAIEHAIGEPLAKTIPASVLDDKKTNETQAGYVFAQLMSTRIAFAPEGQRGARLNAALIKGLTGGDQITCRQIYQRPYTYTPRWKLYLTTNDLPHADAEDKALWRRIVVLPFDVQVDQKDEDKKLKHVLCNDEVCQRAILKWLVDGAVKYYRAEDNASLIICSEVQEATRSYQDSSDYISNFLADCFDTASDDMNSKIYTSISNIKSVYNQWNKDINGMRIDGNDVIDALRKRGYTDYNCTGADKRRFKALHFLELNETGRRYLNHTQKVDNPNFSAKYSKEENDDSLDDLIES